MHFRGSNSRQGPVAPHPRPMGPCHQDGDGAWAPEVSAGITRANWRVGGSIEIHSESYDRYLLLMLHLGSCFSSLWPFSGVAKLIRFTVGGTTCRDRPKDSAMVSECVNIHKKTSCLDSARRHRLSMVQGTTAISYLYPILSTALLNFCVHIIQSQAFFFAVQRQSDRTRESRVWSYQPEQSRRRDTDWQRGAARIFQVLQGTAVLGCSLTQSA